MFQSAVPGDFGSIAAPDAIAPSGLTTATVHPLQLPNYSSRAVREVAFIDGGLSDTQTLINGLKPGTAVYVLDPTGDELNQITQVLAGYHDLAAVSLFSHGSDGALQLGSTSLNPANLLDYAGLVQSWSNSLSADADLLLYGCDVAADATGQSFVQQIAALTGADVAASTDLTGSSALGGNWNLEFSTGKIEAATPLSDRAQAAYAGILGTFDNPATNYGVGSVPVSVVIGDLNGDGKPDLAVANINSNDVSVLLGTGSGGFNPATNYSVGSGPFGFDSVPFSVVIGDLNGDGKPDLVTANNSSNDVSVLLGNSSGGFNPATKYSAGDRPYSLAIGDLNGDGKLDLAVANINSNDVSVLLGTGSGGFNPATNYSVGSNPQSVMIGDLNGDGKLDLVTANNSSNDVSVLLGNGSGGFNPATNYSVGSRPFSVAIGDLSGDGKLDLAVANFDSNNVSVLLGNGSGGFNPATNYSAGSRPISVAIGDLNGDSKLDLVTANADSNNVSVLLNTTNRPPVARDDSFTTNEDTALTGNVITNTTPNGLDSDPDGNPISIATVNGNAANVGNPIALTKGNLTLNTDGSFSYTPNANANGSDSFTYLISDGTVSSNTATVNLNITPVNDAPVVANPLANQSSPEDTAVNFTLPANTFSDVDDATLSLSATLGDDNPLPNWLSFNATTRTFSGTPPQDFNGTVALKVTATDAAGASASSPFNLVITPVNDAPTATNDPLTDIAEDSGDRIIPFATLLGNDSTGPANESDQTLTITALTNVVGGTATISGTNIVFTPTANYNGAASFQYTVQDNGTTNGVADPKSAITTASFTITSVNDAPSGADKPIVTGTSYTFTVADFGFTDPNDTPANSLQAVIISSLPSIGQLTLNGVAVTAGQTIAVAALNAGQLRFAAPTFSTPPATPPNPATFTFRVQDNGGTANGGIDTDPTPNTLTINYGLNLNGGNGIDTIRGAAGNDTLRGGNGNDILFGNDGDDALFGDNGDDRLRGGLGNDTLTGGLGSDTVILAIGEGTDTITDFKVGTDKIGLTGGLTRSQLTIEVVGGRTRIRLTNGGDLLAWLDNVTTPLTDSDFTLV